MRFKVGCDLDGVLSNFTKGWAEVLKKMGHTVPDFDAYGPPVWDWPLTHGIDATEVDRSWDTIRNDPDFWFNLEPYPDAEEFLGDLGGLADAGHDIYFLTKRAGQFAKYQSEDWIIQHSGGSLGNPTVLLIPDDKSRIALELGLTHVLEDSPTQLRSYCLFRAAYPNFARVFSIKRCYNEGMGAMPMSELNSPCELSQMLIKEAIEMEARAESAA